MEERHRRADNWMQRAREQITSIEPEWWLRMECGQLAEETSADQYTRMKRVMQRAETEFRHFTQNRARPNLSGPGWLP
jgi:hypothetical protein